MIFILYRNSDHRIRDHSIPSFGTFVAEHVDKHVDEHNRCERARELVAVMAMIVVHASRNEVSSERCWV